MTYDASSRKDVRKAEKEARQVEIARFDVIKGIMATGAGRRWMLERLERCHVFASSFTTSALQTAFTEGERNIGLIDLLDIMAACPERYVEMMQERNARDVGRSSNNGANPDGSAEDGDDSEPNYAYDARA